jgi:hypothetical protein
MKFLTRELLDAADDRLWNDALQRHIDYESSIYERLPSNVKAIARCDFHDLEVLELRHDAIHRTCEVRTVAGSLRFTGVTHFEVDFDIELEESSFAWLYEEWDVNSEGHVSLAVLCDAGEFQITATGIESTIRKELL